MGGGDAGDGAGEVLDLNLRHIRGCGIAKPHKTAQHPSDIAGTTSRFLVYCGRLFHITSPVLGTALVMLQQALAVHRQLGTTCA